MNIDDNLRVEVTHGHRLFPAAVIDASKDLITVQYEDGTNQSISAAEQGKIRKSHHCNNNLAITPEIVQSLVPQHTQLEIKSTSTISTENSVSQPLECWERMKFVAKAGENLLILSCFSESSNTQVVDLSAAGDSIRMPNSSQTAAAGGDWSSEHCCVHFEHMKIEDKQVQELCKSTPSVNDEFCKRIGAQKIYFNAIDENLVVVHNNPDNCPSMLDLFQKHHIGSLARMAVVAKKVQEQESLLHDEQNQARFTGEVKVSIELVKFGILDRVKGKFYHGKRIREAKLLKNVLEIFVQVFPQGSGESDSTGFVVIRIVAKTQEALDKASSMLKFTELAVYIPNAYTTRVIGKDGTLIQDLIDKCGILRVAVLKKDMIPAEMVDQDITPFVLIGLESKLTSAKALIDYQISYLQQEENLEAKFKNLQVEIKKVRGHFLNTDGETDRQTESDSGYAQNLTVKLPTSWAVEEFPPAEDLAEEQAMQKAKLQKQKQDKLKQNTVKNNNRNRRNQTDTEGVTDTEAYQSDAAPVKNQFSFAAKLAANKAAGDAMPKTTKKPTQQLDTNNNVVIGNGPEKNGQKMVKKDYTTKKQQAQQNSDTEKSGGDNKPLPPRNNSGPSKRQIRNQQFREKKQAEQKQQELLLASKLPAPVVPVEVQGVSVAADLFV